MTKNTIDKYTLGPNCDTGCLDQGVRVCEHDLGSASVDTARANTIVQPNGELTDQAGKRILDAFQSGKNNLSGGDSCVENAPAETRKMRTATDTSNVSMAESEGSVSPAQDTLPVSVTDHDSTQSKPPRMKKQTSLKG